MEALRLKESARDAERDAGAVEESECDGDEHDPHPRAYSMSTSERPGEPPSMHRTGSDPAPPRPASNPQQTPQPQSADHDARRPLLSPAGEARKNLSLRLDALGR
ncbi:hypothetical protein PLICRDRAFT_141685 [Plicaturopsis crispa FD-325 SS-3]|nr:hypothetical protein PLICRDRAFT_141685 [Plicaturopsis crispa FD-325 SS-3]